MATRNEKSFQYKNGFKNRIAEKIDTTLLQWSANITYIDLSNKSILTLDDNVQFPPNLCNLNLSNNGLVQVPDVVLKLKKLQTLDLSHNLIGYFDKTPDFCHVIETLDLSHNHLAGPPYWVWTESPSKLSKLNLNYNFKLSQSFQNGYLEELLQYNVSVSEVNISNCKLGDHMKLFNTFSKVKTLHVGMPNYSNFANHVGDAPCIGLNKCCDIERLILCNTQIYTIKSDIVVFKNIVEINMSHNYISDLPNEFCDLVNLEICVLSHNNLLYLPDNIYKLNKLTHLYIDCNELCTLPERIVELNLHVVDLYNNGLYEVLEEIKNVAELDLAQNFFDEPDDPHYAVKKGKLRLNITDRFDGRKIEEDRQDSEQSHCTTDDEELLCSLQIDNNDEVSKQNYDPPSSPEDWDSDEYWVPGYTRRVSPPAQSPWLFFVKKKMAEGHFCPMDAHPVSVAEIVKYEKMCNPRVWHESEGQFDDYSDDNS
ncbi:leucine-rich repeat protein SHOC-2-like [Galleria mellonella]|uniref:Leucine-rich repeat protein SHOC-2-like n=1 Tax=Galleria mellonella TaxID=7137 RepID=A0A6J1WSB6_GALME|nr:leucine-rich repeat protein SHOC-2-like [Galleria mellonella]